MNCQHKTQEVIRACIRPGMLVRHNGSTWTAGANTCGKLILSTVHSSKCIKDCFVEVLLNARGEPLGNYSKDTQWSGRLSKDLR